MSRNLSQITNQNTFGVWKTRTNDIISVIGSVVTIGDSETNTGNIVIDGNVSASGTLFIDTIQETSGNGNNLITINSDLGVEGDIIMDQSSGATTLTYSLANTPTWTIGTSADHTTLDIKKGTTYLRITDGGSLTGANLTIDADLFPTSGDPIALDTTGNAATATAWAASRTVTFATGAVTGNFSIDGSADVSDIELAVDGDEVTIPNANVTGLDTLLNAKADLTGAVFTGDVQITADEYIYFGNQNNNLNGYVAVGYGDFNSGSRIFSVELNDGSSNDVDSMVIDLDGKSLYISNQQDSKLSINGVTGSLVTEGDITAFGTVSDRNRKENIVKIENALDKVSQISGYTFNYIGDDTPMTGVIAQELEEVLPEVVYETASVDGTQSKAVRHGNIVGLLIESIKELKAEIEELKKDK
jgi:hypothetical protein